MSAQTQTSFAADVQESFFEKGLAFSAGRSGRVDLIEAHKWFNIAAAQGDQMAARHREELASEMTREEIAAALRSAREFLKRH